MRAPLIGITTLRDKNKEGYYRTCMSEAYSIALIQAGGLPILIPSGIVTTRLLDLIYRLDGILFSGGGDIEPEKYRYQTNSAVSGVDLERDDLEIQLLDKGIKAEVPFLGICRGLQLINVALGGSLYLDLQSQWSSPIQHQSDPSLPRDHLAHSVEIVPDSSLMHIFQTQYLEVNSHHHQGIKEIAPDLRATAYASDGLIEGVELDFHPYGLAVQWHPECLLNQVRTQQLFKSFVAAAKQYANQKSS